jgi:hypothetical protein
MTIGTRSEHDLGTACARSYMCELAFIVTSVSNSLKPLYIVIMLQYIVIINVIRPTVIKRLALKFYLFTSEIRFPVLHFCKVVHPWSWRSEG